MRRHREDIFHTTCTACKDLDRRGDNFSVTLSGASAESKGLEFAEHAPVRFVRIYANPPSGPLDCARGDRAMHNGSRCSNLRDSSTAPPAPLGMTEQFPMHNYSAHSFCHLERSVSGVERSRHSRTFILAKHPRCSQPTKDETFECSPSPGVAADCRRKAPIRPTETLGKTEMTTFFAKKVILLLQSEKFVLFLNRDPPIGGRLR